MIPNTICQSCTMPIDNMEDRGTEKDGSKSNLFCKYCYTDGSFTDPEMTLEQMKINVAAQMEKMKLPEAIIQKSIDLLPHLKRWQLFG
jgi:hypothetical protein